MSKLTPEQRITRAHVSLMRSPEFCLLSGILMMGSSTVSDTCPTAYTNGRDKVYGRAFIEPLSEQELNFLVVHENYHVMFKHMTTWKKLADENAQLANAAMDYVINGLIVEADPNRRLVKFIDGGCLDHRFDGMDVKQVYTILKSEAESEAKSKPNSGEGDGDGDGQPDSGGHGVLDEHDFDAAASMSDAEIKELESAVDQAVRQGVLVAGKMGGSVSRAITDLVEAKIDWREQLADFIRSACSGRDMSTWRRPNRRYLAQGDYRPSSYSEALGDIVIGIDTSGSIGGVELGEFLAEVKSLVTEMNPSKVHLVYWDSEVAGVEQYSQGGYESLIDSTKPVGGGGTRVGALFDWVESEGLHVECAVVLSDLCTPWCAEPPYPVMFACNSGLTAPFGKTIQIK